MRRLLFGVLGLFLSVYILAITMDRLHPDSNDPLRAAASHVLAFGSIRTGGQNAEHEKITRAALSFLSARTLDEVAGKNNTFGAVAAPDNPKRGLVLEQTAHCDNGDFLDGSVGAEYGQTKDEAKKHLDDCRAWIFKNLDDAIALAAPLAKPDASNTALNCPFDGKSGSTKCQVLEKLGLAFHAAQDFYSHTNWTDKPASGPTSAQNPPGLANSSPAPYIDPRVKAAFPAGLMSGCFKYPAEWLWCHYGFPPHNRVKHAFLNKDTGPIGPSGATGPGTTDRGKINGNFERAVGAAIADTQNKYGYFEERVIAAYGADAGARINCMMRADDPAKCPEKVVPPPPPKPVCAKGDRNVEYQAVLRMCNRQLEETAAVIQRFKNWDERSARLSAQNTVDQTFNYLYGLSCNELSTWPAQLKAEAQQYERGGYQDHVADLKLNLCVVEALLEMRQGGH